MSKITLSSLSNLQNENTAVAALNANFDIIVDAIDNTLSRDGSTPNQMESTLDMNSNHIINLPAPSGSTEPVRLQDLTAFGDGLSAIPAGGLAGDQLTKRTDTDYDAVWLLDDNLVQAGTGLINTNGVISIDESYPHNWTSSQRITATAATSSVFLNITNNSTAGQAQLITNAAGVGATGAFGVSGTTDVTSPAIYQNRSYASGTGGAGLLVNARGALPVVFGSNDIEVARIRTGFMIGTTTDPGAGILNILTGLRINNAAATGNVLRGDGTNFVSSALGVSDLSGFGAGVAAFLATPSSANLKTAVTDETGSGALVFANTPTLVTPVLGAATATSINGVALAGSGATLSMASGKTLAISNSLTFQGTDSTLFIFPSANGNVLTADSTNTLTNKTYNTAGTGNTFQIAGTGITAVTGSGSVVLATAPTGFFKVVKRQQFTANGTYTPSTGLVYAIIECVGGGGGGGGVTGTAANFYVGGGGGSGGYARSYVSAATVGASQSVTIGTAGAGGAAGSNAGTAGGDTSVGAITIGKGGAGGNFSSAAQNGIGGVGGVSGTGDFTCVGAPGGGGFYNSVNANIGMPAGVGGSSIFGGGATATTAHATGVAASNYGSGGSGGSSDNGSNFAGGNGSAGVVLITEFCNQ